MKTIKVNLSSLVSAIFPSEKLLGRSLMTFPNSSITLSFHRTKNADFKFHCMSKTSESLLNTHYFLLVVVQSCSLYLIFRKKLDIYILDHPAQ